ncbi:hypothetical protein DPMN_089227 [Dreissena polymorpha]|uniref:Uncharacterized protein n=1 Tax=Dreissena polymorpha TaxID=45954 RepID=A0A9D4KVK5_DREPO|nr:hypothetical protein DPMN_089227 [Dreissena polymorpha]
MIISETLTQTSEPKASFKVDADGHLNESEAVLNRVILEPEADDERSSILRKIASGSNDNTLQGDLGDMKEEEEEEEEEEDEDGDDDRIL